MSAVSTTITKGLAAIALAGALTGGLAACGGSAGTGPAPEPSTSTTAPAPAKTAPAQANPTEAIAAWVAAGGPDALASVGRTLSVMGENPTQQQIAALRDAIAEARSRPMPSSLDPKGAYPAMLAHLEKTVIAYANGDIAAALSESGSVATDTQTLENELKAAGFQVSP